MAVGGVVALVLEVEHFAAVFDDEGDAGLGMVPDFAEEAEVARFFFPEDGVGVNEFVGVGGFGAVVREPELVGGGFFFEEEGCDVDVFEDGFAVFGSGGGFLVCVVEGECPTEVEGRVNEVVGVIFFVEVEEIFCFIPIVEGEECHGEVEACALVVFGVELEEVGEGFSGGLDFAEVPEGEGFAEEGAEVGAGGGVFPPEGFLVSPAGGFDFFCGGVELASFFPLGFGGEEVSEFDEGWGEVGLEVEDLAEGLFADAGGFDPREGVEDFCYKIFI